MQIESKTIMELLENGVHFGHQTTKWNPKMRDYIFGEKSGIYIIDLLKTEKALNDATKFLRELVTASKKILFVGTKKQAQAIIREAAERSGMFFVNVRWLGGCLTNFATIRKSVDRLNALESRKGSEDYKNLTKKEKAVIDREIYKLLKNLEGIRNMDRLPDALIVVDVEAEATAIREAKKMKIPVVALIDTNCDPNIVTYPIPGNDDAIRSIRYIISKLTDAIEEGRGTYHVEEKEEVLKEKIEEPIQVQEEETVIKEPEITAEKIEEEGKEEEEDGIKRPKRMKGKSVDKRTKIIEGDIELGDE